MAERPRTWQQAERRALVADLVRTQATLQARSEQLEAIFASRWYRLARLAWRLRRGRLRKAGPPQMAGGGSYARSLDGEEAGTEVRAAAATVAALDEELERRSRLAGARMRALEAPAGEPGPGEPAAADPDASREPARLLLAGHGFGFCEEIAARARRGGATVREDRWQRHGAHEEAASAAALAWADTIHCEWCLGNAVWYSRNKRPGQRLVVRFHRMELETPYPGEVDLERVDAMVFVARHVLEQACERGGWDPGDRRFEVLPNGVDVGPLRLPKLPGARFTLAAIGYVPRLKRLDLALDVLEALRERDDRYRLLVKGREPWEYPWMSARDGERDFYEDLFDRVERTPGLRGAVRFEPFGDDVPAFLRRAGWALSTSEVEGHSVALAEAMASGAVPAVLERPGAREQYEPRWVHADPAAAAEAILATQARDETEAEGEAARRFAEERWSWERLWPAWDRLLLGGGSAAAQGAEAVAAAGPATGDARAT
jgi:glycosyltransferase involved in cell wall biosynthesis